MNNLNLIFFILIALLCYLLRMTKTGSKFKNDFQYINPDTKEVCNNLYLFFKNKKYKVVSHLLSEKICDDIIKETKGKTKKNGWFKKRHQEYPTTDIPFDNTWKSYQTVKKIVEKKIYNILTNMYKINKNKLLINEMFVVKYSMDGQRELEYHEDGSEFSFIIGLNEEYNGGGTTFEFNKDNIKLKKGSGLIFSGQNTHKGEYLKDGTRYILTGFINYGEENECQDYIEEVLLGTKKN